MNRFIFRAAWCALLVYCVGVVAIGRAFVFASKMLARVGLVFVDHFTRDLVPYLQAFQVGAALKLYERGDD